MPYRLAIAQKWWRGTDSNRRTLRERIYSPPRLATSLPLHKQCRPEDLNPQPTDYKSVALPIELDRHDMVSYAITGTVVTKTDPKKWWRMTGSNRRPSACKADALPAELILRSTGRTSACVATGRCDLSMPSLPLKYKCTLQQDVALFCMPSF